MKATRVTTAISVTTATSVITATTATSATTATTATIVTRTTRLTTSIRKKPFPQLRSLLSRGKREAYLPHMPQLINFPQLLQIYLILLTSPCVYLIKLAASSYISYAKIFYDCCLFCLSLWTSTFYASSKTYVFLLFL